MKDVETYSEDDVWKTRREDSKLPFATGGSRSRQIAIGGRSRWNHLRHIIRNGDGTIAEINVYSPSRFPSRTPTTTMREFSQA